MPTKQITSLFSLRIPKSFQNWTNWVENDENCWKLKTLGQNIYAAIGPRGVHGREYSPDV